MEVALFLIAFAIIAFNITTLAVLGRVETELYNHNNIMREIKLRLQQMNNKIENKEP